MSPGRDSVSLRLLKYFNLIYITEFEDDTLHFMVNKIFEWGFAEFPSKIINMTKNIANLCLMFHKDVRNTFLPLPVHSHYVFNLRDLMKLVQGIFRGECEDVVTLLRLCVNESMCVYSDRLIN